MRKTRLLLALTLTTLIASSALATETAPNKPEPEQASVEVTLPDEITGRLTPKPVNKYGQKMGPCTVSVACRAGYTISCSGQTVCYWKIDNYPSYSAGFVECDGTRTYCGLIE